jgi:hypothetical protein
MLNNFNSTTIQAALARLIGKTLIEIAAEQLPKLGVSVYAPTDVNSSFDLLVVIDGKQYRALCKADSVNKDGNRYLDLRGIPGQLIEHFDFIFTVCGVNGLAYLIPNQAIPASKILQFGIKYDGYHANRTVADILYNRLVLDRHAYDTFFLTCKARFDEFDKRQEEIIRILSHSCVVFPETAILS